jgi:hypothetical protein
MRTTHVSIRALSVNRPNSGEAAVLRVEHANESAREALNPGQLLPLLHRLIGNICIAAVNDLKIPVVSLVIDASELCVVSACTAKFIAGIYVGAGFPSGPRTRVVLGGQNVSSGSAANVKKVLISYAFRVVHIASIIPVYVTFPRLRRR